MKQILHIFGKDVCRLWIELLICTLALAGFTWLEWRDCTPERDTRWYTQVLPLFVLVIAWWFLTVRLIHAEALVGDRQFWLTRPYIWYKLLAAKVLFVVACIGAPLIISNMVLLAMGHFPLMPHMGSVLRDTAVAVMICVLPVAAIAAITRSLAQWMLGVVALILSLAGILALVSFVGDSTFITGVDFVELLQAAAFAVLAALGITIQYAARKHFLSTLLIVMAVLSIPAIMIAIPHRKVIVSVFPVVRAAQAPVHVEFGPAEAAGVSVVAPQGEEKVTIMIPFEASTIQSGTLAELKGAALSVGAPEGQRWESEWVSPSAWLLGRASRIRPEFEMERAVYDDIKNTPVPLWITLAFTQLRDAHPRRAVAYREFGVAGIGRCWLVPGGDINCRSTADGPPEAMVAVRDSDTGVVFRKTIRTSTTTPFGPLRVLAFDLTGIERGSVLTFSTPEFVRRFRLNLKLGDVRLSEYSTEKPTLVTRR